MYDSGFKVQVLGITVQGLGIEGYGFGAYLLEGLWARLSESSARLGFSTD